MKATKGNTIGKCERCHQPKPYVLASGFNADGSFRMLCTPCDNVERWSNQRRLFDMSRPRPKPVEIEPEPEPVKPKPQMSLF